MSKNFPHKSQKSMKAMLKLSGFLAIFSAAIIYEKCIYIENLGDLIIIF
jgi:hypothetical protein